MKDVQRVSSITLHKLEIYVPIAQKGFIPPPRIEHVKTTDAGLVRNQHLQIMKVGKLMNRQEHTVRSFA